MTRDRIIGEDTPFGAWMRRNEKLSSTEFVTCDIDHCIHRYKTTVDGYGTREIQNLMFLEVKQFGAGLRDSQRDTLYKLHKTMSTNGVVRIDGSFIRNWGVSVLALHNMISRLEECLFNVENTVNIEYGNKVESHVF